MMKPSLLAAGALVVGLALAPASGHAANADNPYGNVDRRNDAGNDTGDSKVDRLNAGQLNQNYQGPTTYRAPAQPPPPSAVQVVPVQPAPVVPAAPQRR